MGTQGYEDHFPMKSYYDSEEVGCHVRHLLHKESRKPFDYGGGSELPLRKDVLNYVQGQLFAAGGGLIRAAGLPLPGVSLDADGTAKVVFSVDGRHVSLWVPCDGVVVLERYTEEADGYLQFVLRSDDQPAEFDDEVERAFRWAEGGGDE